MTGTLVVGEALVDVVHSATGQVEEHVGGSPLNVAIGLARLGHRARLATFIADDAYGAAIQQHLAASDVQLVEGSLSAPRTPKAVARLDDSGAATYDFDIAWDLPYPLPTAIGHFHTGSIATVLQPGATRVSDAMLAARDHATVSLDPNARPSLMGDPHDVRSHMEQLVGYSDVVKASDEDLDWLYGANTDADLPHVMRLWAQLGPALVVVTRGGKGALAYVAATDSLIELPVRTVTVVDTVGAGDSFQSGLLSGLLDAGLLGGPDARTRLRTADADAVHPALERAVAASAITVSRAGANPPTRAELG